MKRLILPGALFLTVIFLLPSCTAKITKKKEKPNIVFIMADDLGYGELGCYGQGKIRTPNIDKLAENGMKFTDFYSGAPVCAPARCMLLTGRHPGHAQIRGNNEMAKRGDVWDYIKASHDPNLEGQYPLRKGTQTLGTLLQAAGYKTAAIGKWGLGGPLTDGRPTQQGFDLFFGYNCQRQAHNYYPGHLWRNDTKVPLDNKLFSPHQKLPVDADPYDPESYEQYKGKAYAPDLMIKEALHFIEENKEHPFFLYYPTTIPHVALQAPDKWIEKYHKIFGEEEPYTGNHGYLPCRYPRATYAAMISYLDNQVGQIVDKLKELRLLNNTIIFFTSDNGPTYVGGVDTRFFDSAKPFKADYGWGKGFTREGGIREPLIAYWPGHIKPGSQSNFVGAFWDVLPTLCDLAGVQAPDSTDGISFLPALLQEGKQKRHEYLYWEFPAYTGQQAVRMGHWKAIRDSIFKGNMRIKLYDLNTDIQESHDISSEKPQVVDKIKKIMKEAHVPSKAFRLGVVDRQER
ncbi:MAG: arylsulfatase [Bacteroidales bacterium]|nr:arylsulfatase [Bacteroidales bacterium]